MREGVQGILNVCVCVCVCVYVYVCTLEAVSDLEVTLPVSLNTYLTTKLSEA